MADLICIGEMVIDFLPGSEEGSYIRNAGGAPANVAIAAAKNGLKAAMCCKVGDDNFGHFLMESTSRLWYWTEHQDLSIAFLVARKKGIIQQFWEFMDLLGASKEKIHLITEPTHFKEIHIPTQAHTFVTRYDDKFLIPFRHIANRIGEIKSYDKIYLSRTKFKTGTPCYGEEIIEKIFRDNGFKTVYPEHLSLKEQITYIKGAQEIAGINGTATHLLVFANDNIKSIILERSDEAMPEQAIVNQAIKADWYNIGVNMNPFPVKHSAGPILLGVTKELAAFCDNHYMHVAPNYLNYVSNKNSKHFIKNYMEIYTYITKNRELYAKYPVLADRLLNMSNAYLPLKKKIKQKIKEWKKQL